MLNESKMKFLKKVSNLREHLLFQHKCISISILTDIVEQINSLTDLDDILNVINAKENQQSGSANLIRKSFVSTEFAIQMRNLSVVLSRPGSKTINNLIFFLGMLPCGLCEMDIKILCNMYPDLFGTFSEVNKIIINKSHRNTHISDRNKFYRCVQYAT